MIIRCEFLTARYVAKETHDAPEWPPHPARLFYALVSSLCVFNTEVDARDNRSEREALEWLEGLGHPEIVCTPHRKVGTRKVVTHHVPANDPDSSKKPDHLPEHRGRNERTFPTLLLPETSNSVYYCWPGADESRFNQHRASFETLFQRVSYLGHSSSLVTLGFVTEFPASTQNSTTHWLPTPGATGGLVLRGFAAGLLELLGDVYLPNEYSQQNFRLPYTGVTYVERGSLRCEENRTPTSHFGEKWIVYRLPEWARMPMTAVLGLTTNLKSEACRLAGVPTNEAAVQANAMLSGHQPGEGKPYEGPHVAFVGLPYVGHANASGAIFGLGAILPRSLEEPQQRMLSEAIHQILHRIASLPFRGSSISLERLTARDLASSTQPKTLQPPHWCAESRVWGSVTPMALDRYPGFLFGRARKSEADVNRTEKALTEARASLRQSCANIGLPVPSEVDISRVSWIESSPPVGKFVSPKREHQKPPPVYAHVRLVFDERVRGPILLGKQRYLGMGLFCLIKHPR